MAQYTLENLVDKAVEKLPPLKKNRLKRIFAKRPRLKQDSLDELAVCLCDDAECCLILGAATAGAILGSLTVGNTPIELDLDQLERLLQIIIEYLPQIIEIIMKLFA